MTGIAIGQAVSPLLWIAIRTKIITKNFGISHLVRIYLPADVMKQTTQMWKSTLWNKMIESLAMANWAIIPWQDSKWSYIDMSHITSLPTIYHQVGI
jgi:hypothetical protein